MSVWAGVFRVSKPVLFACATGICRPCFGQAIPRPQNAIQTPDSALGVVREGPRKNILTNIPKRWPLVGPLVDRLTSSGDLPSSPEGDRS